MHPRVPSPRIRAPRDQEPNRSGAYVLYWMTAARRLEHNHALDRAVAWSLAMGKPLLVLESLRCGYRWASDRLHRFVIEGMLDQHRLAAARPVTYYPFLERRRGEADGLLPALAERACVVVSDDYPCFFLPALAERAARRLDCRLELIDGNGLLPMRAASRTFARAFDFRRYLQAALPDHLPAPPLADPFSDLAGPARLGQAEPPARVLQQWPVETLDSLREARDRLDRFPIDHQVGPGQATGGAEAARRRLRAFLEGGLPRYADDRNHPDLRATSGLSPYLHFGHLSAHEVAHAVLGAAGWKPSQLSRRANGKANGWWGLDASSEGFLDQLVTWRELGFNMCSREANHARYGSLPRWARATLEEHARDPRPHCYSLEQLAAAETDDELWNAAQRQLTREGVMHNYLRMLWGKRVLQWTATPQEALRRLIELNNRFALDGRDPNSLSGIFWCLGRYDRAWGPERPIFGKVRYMTSENTRRKLRLREYLARYAAA